MRLVRKPVRRPLSLCRPAMPDSLPDPRNARAKRNAIQYNPFMPANFLQESESLTPSGKLLHFVRLLRQRYASVLKHIPEDSARALYLSKGMTSLALAEAFLHRIELYQVHTDSPLQLAVIGPTQAGKSSIVNLLLEEHLAKVSPLAGFTVHPQGFCLNVGDHPLNWLSDYYSGYQRLPPAALPARQYGYYAVTAASPQPDKPLPTMVIWDTPDFDSIDAHAYRDAVLKTAALADLILLVVSKDKYADQSVWEMMTLLEPLAQPTVICLNKITDRSRDIVVQSLKQKWLGARQDAPAPIIPLPYLENWGTESWETLQSVARPLWAQVKTAIRDIRRDAQPHQARRLLRVHWAAWLEPVLAEHRVLAEWRALVDQAVRDGLHMYRRDYLDHPQHYETFQRALAELLTLLEIPGLARSMTVARQVITWPVRQIVKLGRTLNADRRGDKSHEVAMLRQIVEHAFIWLAETALLKREESTVTQDWWRQLSDVLRLEKKTLMARAQEATQDYFESFQPEIERTARSLYDQLQEHPAMLNSLRATRVTTDAAALALAFKTGGIGLHDFIITPAVLSLTSLMTESALGHYMNRAVTELKRRQYAAVEQLFGRLIRDTLRRLPERLDPADKFNVPPETVEAAAALLK
jgi:GTPase SAR1 family protein